MWVSVTALKIPKYEPQFLAGKCVFPKDLEPMLTVALTLLFYVHKVFLLSHPKSDGLLFQFDKTDGIT